MGWLPLALEYQFGWLVVQLGVKVVNIHVNVQFHVHALQVFEQVLIELYSGLGIAFLEVPMVFSCHLA